MKSYDSQLAATFTNSPDAEARSRASEPKRPIGRAARKGRADDQVVNEDQMNRFALDLSRMGRAKDAIEVLKQNVVDHPESFNVYDSLSRSEDDVKKNA